MKPLSFFAAAAAICLHAPCGAATTIGTGPYYAVPAWDQTLPATTRFLVLANFNQEAVLDRETGLVWQRSPLRGPYLYPDGEAACFSSRVGGRMGWRLPSISEMTSLFDPAATEPPFLPAGHPFLNLALPGTWLTSTFSRTNDVAVYFVATRATDVLVASIPYGLGGGQVWCVRAST